MFTTCIYCIAGLLLLYGYIHMLMSPEPDYYKPRAPEPIYNRYPVMTTNYTIYISKRYVIHGNLQSRITITDKRDDECYEFTGTALTKFRRIFNYIPYVKREQLIALMTTDKVGRKSAA